MRSLILAGLVLAAGAAPSHAQIPDDMLAALRAADADALQAVLDNGADANARQVDGLQATALMYAASTPDPALAEALIAAGAEVDTPDIQGDPALNWAAYYGHDRVVAVLLEAGADAELTGHGNARQILMRRGHQDALGVLLDYFEPDSRMLDAAHLEILAAVMNGNRHGLAHAARQTDLAAVRDRAGRPVLHVAARFDQAPAIEALLDAGAPVDATDAIGFTALFEAARECSADAVGALIAAGADVDHVSDTSSLALTPVHLAAIGGDADCVAALLAAGANPDVRGTTGATPMLWAVFEGQEDAVLALIDGGADPHLALEDGTSVRAIAEQRGWAAVVARIDEQG